MILLRICPIYENLKGFFLRYFKSKKSLPYSMPVPKHAPGCHGRAYPSKCPKCHGKVFYFACSCGNKTFYRELGGDWPEHVCKEKKVKVRVPYIVCEKCAESMKELLYAEHLLTCQGTQVSAIPSTSPTQVVTILPAQILKSDKDRYLKTCEYCGVKVGARRMKIHLKRCPKLPKT